MILRLFLAPGRLLCGNKQPKGRKRMRYSQRNPYRASQVIVSILVWLAVFGGAWALGQRLLRPDPPPPLATLSGQTEPDSSAAPVFPAPGQGPAQPAQAPGGIQAGLAALQGRPQGQAPASQEGQPAGQNSQPQTELRVPDDLRVPAGQSPAASPQVWLVIVESIPKAARAQAEEALARHKRRGVNLELMDTDAFPRLKSGMWTLAMGPFESRAEAEAKAAEIKPKVRDLMVRRGI
jgi:hypothetical protein